jgi:hypothetical protein
MWRADSLCTIIPLMKAQSAHSRSFFRSFVTLASTKRFDHPGGSIAATVSRPNGGEYARLRTNLSACLKPQKVSGDSGYIRITFTGFLSHFLLLDLEANLGSRGYCLAAGYAVSTMRILISSAEETRTHVLFDQITAFSNNGQ